MSVWQSKEIASQPGSRARSRSRARSSAFACALLLASALSLAVAASDVAAQDEDAQTTTVNGMHAPSEEKPPAKTTLRGHVAYETTGRPVRRSHIILLGESKNSGELTGMTDARGDFQVKNVSQGKYFIMVNAAGLITPLSVLDMEQLKGNNIDFEEIRKQFEEVSVDGINDKTVEVRARLGGAISGRITYQDGDPAINVHVDIVRRKDGRIGRFIANISPSSLIGFQTDDRGVYRFSGLPPGEYIVSASENIQHGDAGRGRMGGEYMSGINSLAVTYYQNATSIGSATPIKVEAGEDEKNIDITLSDRPLYTLSGIVRSRRDNRPLARAQVTLVNKDESRSVPQSMPYAEAQPVSETDEQGQWAFNEIPDGNYTLIVQPPYDIEEMATTTTTSSSDAPEQTRTIAHNRKKLILKQLDVKIGGRDVTGMLIEMTEGARISGTVTVEGGKPLPRVLIISAQPFDAESSAAARSSVDRKGNFAIDGVPGGKVYLSINSTEQTYYTKSIMMGGATYTRAPLAVQESSEIKDVSIIISSEVSTLTGHVLSSPNGAALGNAHVVLFPVDPALWNTSGLFLNGDADASGLFSVSGAPGEYLVIALRPGEASRLSEEEFFKSRAATAARVTLQANERKSLDLVAPGAN